MRAAVAVGRRLLGPWRPFGELGAGLAQVPGDEGANYTGPVSVADELSEPRPEGLRHGEGDTVRVPVLLVVSHVPTVVGGYPLFGRLARSALPVDSHTR